MRAAGRFRPPSRLCGRGHARSRRRRGELVFDTATSSRKYANLRTCSRVALVIGWDDDITLQCEGTADVVLGADRDRCLDAYIAQYPDGRERARDPDIVLVRVRLDRGRLSDFRPETFGTEDLDLCAET